jgi:hypothetical protein
VNLRLVDDDKEQLAYTQVSVMEEPLVYIFLCILRDLPQQKITRELCGGGRSHYISKFLCSHGKIFQWDGSGKFKKTRTKEWRKEKEEIFTTWRFPYLCVLH